MSMKLSSALVSTAWLAKYLDDPHLRIFDCAVYLGYDPDQGIVIRAGREEYESAHIPGAAFLDLATDLSRQNGETALMMPSPETFCSAMSAAGLGDDHGVVLYSSDHVMWATRMWWMLRASGFTNAAVLDGGLKQWQAEGHPTVTGNETYPQATFTAKPDTSRWVDKESVLAAIGSGSVCTINTLSRKEYLGVEEQNEFEKQAYGRPGRIPGSLNVPYAGLLNEAGLFKSLVQLRQAFEDVGALGQERLIGYCGAGISSTMGALALHLIGYDNVAIYDGSLHEWGRDRSLPMESG